MVGRQPGAAVMPRYDDGLRRHAQAPSPATGSVPTTPPAGQTQTPKALEYGPPAPDCHNDDGPRRCAKAPFSRNGQGVPGGMCPGRAAGPGPHARCPTGGIPGKSRPETSGSAPAGNPAPRSSADAAREPPCNILGYVAGPARLRLAAWGEPAAGVAAEIIPPGSPGWSAGCCRPQRPSLRQL